MSKLVRGYVERAGTGKHGACHLFRHTMATVMLENGADIRFIQQMLGHAELSTTQIYTHVSIKKLKEIHSVTHPARLERISTGAGVNDLVAAHAPARERDERLAELWRETGAEEGRDEP
jgi:integrase/recombinase XerD